MPTKIIMVELEATITMKWAGPVEVPADFNDPRCRMVADEIYKLIDVNDFVEDHHTWERARCSFRELKTVAGEPLFRVRGIKDGRLILAGELPPPQVEDPT